MNKLIVTFLLVIVSVSAKADCWVVSNLTGKSMFSPDYTYTDDKALGVYHISINGNKASVSLVGDTYNSEMSYNPVTPTSIIGVLYWDKYSLIETWTITSDNRVIYTKVRSNPSMFNQMSSFIGDVVGKC